jgi:sterol 3beta-glucosyltransferase
MRISIHTLGTRGDVQPYVALAKALAGVGHEVQLAAPAQFEEFVIGHGAGFAALPAEFLSLLNSAEAKASLGENRKAASAKLFFRFRQIVRDLLDADWAAARDFGAEMILYHPKSVAGPHIAEKLGCPAVLAALLPAFTPTFEFPSPLLPVASLGPFNSVSHRLVAGGADFIFSGMVGAWRQAALGLARKPAFRKPVTTLYGYSRHVVPVPSDWGNDVDVTGYWFLEDAGWEPPQQLAAFLAGGDKPLYIGFGSMPGSDPVHFVPAIEGALRLTGRRAVVFAGNNAVEGQELPPSLCVIDGAPHDRLFPLMDMAVHHGGAGTTAAALRAGIPSVLCPFMGDQPFWARRVSDLGAGVTAARGKALSAERLAAAIDAAGKDAVRRSARGLAEKIAAENGLENAVAAVEKLAVRWRAQAA